MTPTEPPRNRRGADVPRPYHRSGLHAVSRTLPQLLERVTDPAIADAALSPVERAARAWRRDVLGDLGGADQVAAARIALLDAATGSKVILDSIDRYLFGLAARDGLVNRRDRRAFAIVADRMRIADSLARQLQALGLERRRDVPDLTSYLAERYSTEPSGDSGSEATLAPTDDASPPEQPDGRTPADVNDHETHEEVQDADDDGSTH